MINLKLSDKIQNIYLYINWHILNVSFNEDCSKRKQSWAAKISLSLPNK